tara:strand:+ start:7333 stop:8556 length:1224 start_codon:yes stop_codon:yes gene_type:complete
MVGINKTIIIQQLKVKLRSIFRAGVLAGLLVAFSASITHASSRIKDIASFEGVRDNLLVGYGLVVGLNGTGDGLEDGHFTKQSLLAMLERLGVKPTEAGLDSDNVAAVMVTASLHAFARQGSRIDVTVSALGDSSSLLGGTLLVTPLLGADGEVYAVSQGQVAVGGFTAGGAGETVTKGVPTSARIANGGIVEREIKFDLAALKKVHVSLRNPDFTTARRMAQAINAFLGTDAARPSDPGTLVVRIPSDYEENVVGLLTDIEQLRIEPDQLARVIIDEQSGTIVMGENVQISTVAIAQGSLTIRITETPQVSQPGPFAEVGTTTTLRFIPSSPRSSSINSRASRPRSPINPTTLVSAAVWRAIIDKIVDLPTPEPEKMPILCPLQTVRKAFITRTPRSILSPTRWRV